MKFAAVLVAAVSVAEATRFKSGAVTGYEKFTYGKFITRMKAPDKKGTVSSFFTYWNGPNFYPGGWNELDVEIVPSVSQNPFSMNIIYGDGHNKHESHDYMRSFNPGSDWHIYEMAWTPDYIAWSVDNKEVRRVPASDASVKAMTKGQSVMMNFWTPTFESWGQGFNAADMPWYVLYDYVETYTFNTKTKGFDFHWRDDFDTFNPQRWHKSDNTTFDANSTTFRASQSYIDAGHLVLKMEPDVFETLHHGQHWIPPSVLPVKTEPTYEHEGSKMDKAHYDVLEEQHHFGHFDHYDHELGSHAPYHGFHEPMHGEPYYGPVHGRTYYHSRDLESPADIAFDHYARARHHTDVGYHQHADLDHHVPVHHAAPKKEAKKPAAKRPKVKAPRGHHAPEAHISSTPEYYDQMFGITHPHGLADNDAVNE